MNRQSGTANIIGMNRQEGRSDEEEGRRRGKSDKEGGATRRKERRGGRRTEEKGAWRVTHPTFSITFKRGLVCPSVKKKNEKKMKNDKVA